MEGLIAFSFRGLRGFKSFKGIGIRVFDSFNRVGDSVSRVHKIFFLNPRVFSALQPLEFIRFRS